MSKRNEILAEALNCGAFQNDAARGIPANLLVTFEVDELMLFVAKIEREATERAAKLAEAEVVEELTDGDLAYNMATRHCAAAIRAGGDQT